MIAHIFKDKYYVAGDIIFLDAIIFFYFFFFFVTAFHKLSLVAFRRLLL